MVEAVDKAKFSAAIFRRGHKQELFGDGEEDDEEQIELNDKLNDLHSIWGLPRTGMDLSAAIWRPKHRAAQVVRQKGKLLSRIGFMWGSKHFIHIEEALFLVDRANLLLFVDEPRTGKRLLSLHEVQELMTASGMPVAVYLVYCKLMRAGYIVQRHPSRWILKPSETPESVFAPKLYVEAELSQGLPCTVDLRPLKKLRAGLQTADQTVTVGDRAGAASAARADVPAAAADSTRHWWVIPNDQPAWLHGAADLDDSACAELPRCVVEVGPEAATLRDFPMMQPLQTFGLAEAAELDDTDGKQLLHLDVYAPNSHFSRKAPGEPIFIVSVWPRGHPPLLAQAAAVDMAAGSVPVRYSSVEFGDIAFYAMPRTELKTIFR